MGSLRKILGIVILLFFASSGVRVQAAEYRIISVGVDRGDQATYKAGELVRLVVRIENPNRVDISSRLKIDALRISGVDVPVTAELQFVAKKNSTQDYTVEFSIPYSAPTGDANVTMKLQYKSFGRILTMPWKEGRNRSLFRVKTSNEPPSLNYRLSIERLPEPPNLVSGSVSIDVIIEAGPMLPEMTTGVAEWEAWGDKPVAEFTVELHRSGTPRFISSDRPSPIHYDRADRKYKGEMTFRAIDLAEGMRPGEPVTIYAEAGIRFYSASSALFDVLWGSGWLGRNMQNTAKSPSRVYWVKGTEGRLRADVKTVIAEPAKPGGSLTVDADWRAENGVVEQFQPYVRIFDPSGKELAWFKNVLPSKTLQSGEIYREGSKPPFQILIPQDAAYGEYSIRLAAWGAEGDWLPVEGRSEATFKLVAPAKFKLSGYVRNASQSPVKDVSVSIEGVAGSVSTNAAGFYSFSNLSPGIYTITGSKTGFTISSASKTIADGDMADINLTATQEVLKAKLVVKDFRVAPAQVKFNDDITFRITIKNEGAGEFSSTGNQFAIWVGDKPKNFVAIPDFLSGPLPQNQSVTRDVVMSLVSMGLKMDGSTYSNVPLSEWQIGKNIARLVHSPPGGPADYIASTEFEILPALLPPPDWPVPPGDVKIHAGPEGLIPRFDVIWGTGSLPDGLELHVGTKTFPAKVSMILSGESFLAGDYNARLVHKASGHVYAEVSFTLVEHVEWSNRIVGPGVVDEKSAANYQCFTKVVGGGDQAGLVTWSCDRPDIARIAVDVDKIGDNKTFGVNCLLTTSSVTSDQTVVLTATTGAPEDRRQVRFPVIVKETSFLPGEKLPAKPTAISVISAPELNRTASFGVIDEGNLVSSTGDPLQIQWLITQGSGTDRKIIYDAGWGNKWFLDYTFTSAGNYDVFYNLRCSLHTALELIGGPSVAVTVAPLQGATLTALTIYGPVSEGMYDPRPQPVQSGAATEYTCIASYSDNSRRPVDATWKIIAGGSFAKFSQNQLTASRVSSNQTVTIEASHGGMTQTASVTILAPSVTSVVIVGDRSSVPENGSVQFTATATFSDQTTRDITKDPETTWSVEPFHLASILAGKMTANSVNEDQPISVTASYGGQAALPKIVAISDQSRLDAQELTFTRDLQSVTVSQHDVWFKFRLVAGQKIRFRGKGPFYSLYQSNKEPVSNFVGKNGQNDFTSTSSDWYYLNTLYYAGTISYIDISPVTVPQVPVVAQPPPVVIAPPPNREYKLRDLRVEKNILRPGEQQTIFVRIENSGNVALPIDKGSLGREFRITGPGGRYSPHFVGTGSGELAPQATLEDRCVFTLENKTGGAFGQVIEWKPGRYEVTVKGYYPPASNSSLAGQEQSGVFFEVLAPTNPAAITIRNFHIEPGEWTPGTKAKAIFDMENSGEADIHVGASLKLDGSVKLGICCLEALGLEGWIIKAHGTQHAEHSLDLDVTSPSGDYSFTLDVAPLTNQVVVRRDKPEILPEPGRATTRFHIGTGTRGATESMKFTASNIQPFPEEMEQGQLPERLYFTLDNKSGAVFSGTRIGYEVSVTVVDAAGNAILSAARLTGDDLSIRDLANGNDRRVSIPIDALFKAVARNSLKGQYTMKVTLVSSQLGISATATTFFNVRGHGTLSLTNASPDVLALDMRGSLRQSFAGQKIMLSGAGFENGQTVKIDLIGGHDPIVAVVGQSFQASQSMVAEDYPFGYSLSGHVSLSSDHEIMIVYDQFDIEWKDPIFSVPLDIPLSIGIESSSGRGGPTALRLKLLPNGSDDGGGWEGD